MANHTLFVKNSLSGTKEEFKPLKEGYIGMYVCGPTVYSDVHLGNCRTFVSFDIIYRFLLYLGYKVRYVRNITDVGHLLDDGEDRMAKGARLLELEPMEVAHKYTLGFHDMMRIFNTLSPSIEPRATGHIVEQIEMVKTILNNGYAYEKNGSVYFDTQKLLKSSNIYGKLSGRKVDDLLSDTRDNLKNQGEKRHPSDFAIWMKASEDHIMKWPSPWSEGFPGWHLECSAMSTKYLGQSFDIHGGGNDLKFPHHENEIAQNYGACSSHTANYWLHTNMLLMNGRKMSKSDGNTITPYELFSGESPHISKAYSPMVVKFFMLQSHYTSTLDLSDDALSAAEKGYNRLMEAMKTVSELEASAPAHTDTDTIIHNHLQNMLQHMLDDFNTPKCLAEIFELIPTINKIKSGQISPDQVSVTTLESLQKTLADFVWDVLGMTPDSQTEDQQSSLSVAMDLLLSIRKEARDTRNWALSDQIRDELAKGNIALKDGPEGTEWSVE